MRDLAYAISNVFLDEYSRINSTKSPAWGAGNLSEPRLMSKRENTRNHVRLDQSVSAVRTVVLPVFFRLRGSCSHVTEVGRSEGLRESHWSLSSTVTVTTDAFLLWLC